MDEKILSQKEFWVPQTYHQSLVRIGLGYSIRFKLGQMLHEQMFPRKLTTHTDGQIMELG